MSESEKSLEDFFAKKSKKKGAKGKGKKFTTSDEIAKKLVDSDTPPGPSSLGSVSADVTGKKPKAAPAPAPAGGEGIKEENEEDEMNYRFRDDDEWTDFRDESQKDYSGLKIQALQVTDEPPEGEEEEEEMDENGEPIKSKGQGASGPWNKTAESTPALAPAAPAPAPAPAPEPEPAKEEPKPAVVSGGKYVPPNRRGAGASSTSSSSPAGSAQRLGMARKGKAPQISSEFEFPTLAASSDLVKHSNKVDDATFSTVTKGGQQVDSASSKAGDLQLGNRFAALGN